MTASAREWVPRAEPEVLRPPLDARRAAASGAPPAFGAAVALGDGCALVGAPRGGRRGAGEVVVHAPGGPGRGATTIVARLSDPGGAPGDRFGATVVAAGGIAFVGAPRAAREATGEPLVGAVTLHDPAARTGEPPFARLAPPVGIGPAAFGGAIAVRVVEGRPAEIAVGAPGAFHGGAIAAGTVALFGGREVGWSPLARRDAPGGAATAQSFGAALAFVGDTLVIGAPGDGAVAPGAGRIFGLAPDGTLRFQIGLEDLVAGGTPADVAGARFGTSIAAVGDSAVVVGAPGSGAVAIIPIGPSGAAAVSSARVVRGDAAAGFGVRVGAALDAVLVGAPWSSGGVAPSVTELRPDGLGGWSVAAQHQVSAGGLPPGTEFGVALDARGTRLLVGAPSASDPGASVRAGAAYLFRRSR